MTLKTITIEVLLEKMAAGDSAARCEVINRLEARFRTIARERLNTKFRSLRNVTESRSIVNRATRTLLGLEHISATTVDDFLQIATSYMERRLIDLARRRCRLKEHKAISPGGDDDQWYIDNVISCEIDPVRSLERLEEMQTIELLPEEIRNVVKLCGFGGLTQEAAARWLGLKPKQVSRLLAEATKLMLEGPNHVV